MKVGTLTEQKGIVGNLTQWQRREKTHFLERLKSSSLHGSVSMEASWLYVAPWSHHGPPVRHSHTVLIPECSESREGSIMPVRKWTNFANNTNDNNKANF